MDVREELEQFEWHRATWTDDKLIAASPFRDDRRPSFYVWLRDNPQTGAKAGYWGDSGTGERGNLVSLLARLRGVPESNILEYLGDTYCGVEEAEESIDRLDVAAWSRMLPTDVRPEPLDRSILDAYKWRHPYLSNRGISEAVQRMLRVGYCREKRAVTMPWFLPDGRLATIMYRSVRGKAFWYRRGGLPVRDLLYGIDVVYRRNLKAVVLVEAPIDAMYVMTAGIPAVALGGANITSAKTDLLKQSPVETVTIMADHDDAGQAWKRQAVEALSGYMSVKIAGYPARHKDVNEIKDLERVRYFINKAPKVKCWCKLPLKQEFA